MMPVPLTYCTNFIPSLDGVQSGRSAQRSLLVLRDQFFVPMRADFGVTSCAQFAPQWTLTRRVVEIMGRIHPLYTVTSLCSMECRRRIVRKNLLADRHPVLGMCGYYTMVQRSSRVETTVRCISGSHGSSDMAETSSTLTKRP